MKNLKDLLKLVAVAELVTFLTTLACVLVATGGIESVASALFICMVALTPIVIVALITTFLFRGIKSKLAKFVATTAVGWLIGVPTGAMLFIIPLIAVPIIALYFTLYINEEIK